MLLRVINLYTYVLNHIRIKVFFSKYIQGFNFNWGKLNAGFHALEKMFFQGTVE